MPRILKPLTVAQIEKAAATPYTRATHASRYLRDGMVPGLRLYLGKGKSTWLYVATVGAKRVSFPIGDYPDTSLAHAREKAAERRDSVKVMKSTTCAFRGDTAFPETLAELIKVYGRFRGETLRTWAEQLATFRRVFGHLYDRKLLTMPPSFFQHAVDSYQTRNSAASALRNIRPMLKWARKRGYVTFDPMQLDMPKLDYTPRDRVLSDEELTAVLRALGDSPHDKAVKLLLLTACRKTEVTGARWEEFDLDKALWTIPRERMKTKSVHVVPLPVEAVELLRGLPRTNHYIWGVELGNWDRYQKTLFARSGTSGWHRHDLRRTAATILGRLDYEPHILEVVLAHKNVYSRLAATYNHHRYEKSHREALEALSAYYRKLLT